MRHTFCAFRKREQLQTWSDKQNHEEKRPNGALAGDGFPTQKRLSERALGRVFGMFLLRALGRALFMDIRRRAFFVPAPCRHDHRDGRERTVATDVKSNVIDQPAEADADKLGMNAYAEALTEFISGAQSPLTIALQGEWGSGKTSLMNALRSRLVDARDAPYLGVWINTWQYALMSNTDEAIVKILTGLIGQISSEAKTTTDETKAIFGKIARVGGGVLSDIFKKYTGVDLEKNAKEWNADGAPSQSGVEDLKNGLAELVGKALEKEKGKRGFLFFIDDLDRIDPPVAVQILELLKNIFDIPHCIFVLAIDYGVVVKGLKPKFGAMTDENEREFRSFFDKIIQLPFSMPVASYKIDNFLMDSLADIGFLDATEAKDEKLCEALTFYAVNSVGTNPRSLKRLINYLSLIRILIGKTEAKDDDEDFKNWKDVLFALVCLQVKYQKVYDALQGEGDSDFTAWGETFEQKWRIPPLEEGELEKLKKMDEFDEKWEQMLYRFCRREKFLADHALFISKILNRVKARITEADQPVGETVQWLLRLSAVTNVKSEPSLMVVAEDFSKSQFLKDLRWHTLGMRRTQIRDGHAANLSAEFAIHSGQARIQSNLACTLWNSPVEGLAERLNFLGGITFHIFHDGKSFQLKSWGEFWGRAVGDTEKSFHAIDFNSGNVKDDLAKALDAFREAWAGFGVNGNCGCNPGDHVGGGDIWFNATVPFKDHDELVSDAFSKKLRGSLASVANAFASLTKYRVFVNP